MKNQVFFAIKCSNLTGGHFYKDDFMRRIQWQRYFYHLDAKKHRKILVFVKTLVFMEFIFSSKFKF